jgi:hypothetical protein
MAQGCLSLTFNREKMLIVEMVTKIKLLNVDVQYFCFLED